MIDDFYRTPLDYGRMLDIELPRLTGEAIKKAEQELPNSRAARRQEERENKRKWKVRYYK